MRKSCRINRAVLDEARACDRINTASRRRPKKKPLLMFADEQSIRRAMGQSIARIVAELRRTAQRNASRLLDEYEEAESLQRSLASLETLLLGAGRAERPAKRGKP